METIVKIKSIGFKPLNNAEYETFMNYTRGLIYKIGAAKLGIDAELFTAFGKNLATLTDIVLQSRKSALTEQIAQANEAADRALSFLLGTIAAGRNSTVAEDREAFLRLYDVTKPYRSIQQLPLRQQIAQARGLYDDIERKPAYDDAFKLGLWPAAGAVETTNEALAKLIEQRAKEQMAHDLPDARELRNQMTAQYDRMTTLAFVESVKAPTADTENFVNSMNKLIDDTKAAYNLRMGMAHYWQDKQDQTEQEVWEE